MRFCPTCQAKYPNPISYCPHDGAELRTVGAWAEGTLVRGRYRIIGKIGEGGMGAVYKAEHTGFDELRAIKVLNAELSGDEKFHQRFKQEAFITRKLQHPNAVRVDDIDEAEDGSPFMVMEYIEGKSLKRVLREQAPLPPARVCAIAKQVAAALGAAHQLGMVHRDIKPENIVLVQTPAGEIAKVLDFGIARVKEQRRIEGLKGTDLTGEASILGTPMYISPEQAQGKRGDELDGRSDLYSLGVVMYEMLTGELPFKSKEPMEFFIAHIQQPPRPIRTVRLDVVMPDALASLVMKLLQKKRELRPRSAAQLIDELTRVEMGMPVLVSRVPQRGGEATPATSANSFAPTVVAPRPMRPAPAPAVPAPSGAPAGRPMAVNLVWALAVLLLVGVAFTFWYHTTQGSASRIARREAAATEFEHQNLFPQAEGEYRAALRIDPDNAALQSALGHVLVEERNWDEAIKALRGAISLREEDAVAHNNLGVALQTTGNVSEAIPEFREALRIQPDYQEAHSNLGYALEKQNDLNGSVNEYREALRLNPDDADAHFHLAIANYKLGNADLAVEEYREAIRLRSGFALAHFGLGGVLYNRGDHAAGLEELRTAYSLAPDDPEIRAAYQKLLEK